MVHLLQTFQLCNLMMKQKGVVDGGKHGLKERGFAKERLLTAGAAALRTEAARAERATVLNISSCLL